MRGWKLKLPLGAVILLTSWIWLFGSYGLLKPIKNGCMMTYMYPNYIPISSSLDGVSSKYGLYLYHDGWKKKNFDELLKRLSGVPVLFIPGNGGSYKQVRSLAAESDKAFLRGVPDRTFYQEGFLTPEEGGANQLVAELQLPQQYKRRLDWFTIDLEGEYSAMDSQVLEDHTEYVVYAIHRILDQYKLSRDARQREGAALSGVLPQNVILVGHSMGGFVARAAVVHPRLRSAAVETIVTLATPHQSPPVALQASLSQYYSRVNEAWKVGYTVQTSAAGHSHYAPSLSHIIVVSISGGHNDYQVRTKLEALDDIVPTTHGFLISSTSMRNVWLSMEHQVILWCNQLVVQVSHTLLSIVDQRTNQPIADSGKRLAMFAKMLRSGSIQSYHWHDQCHKPILTKHVVQSPDCTKHNAAPCPSHFHWNDDEVDKDIFILNSTITVLAMDGKRRWMDIHKLGSNGKDHFIFVTNLSPCSGVRIHLWPEKRMLTAEHNDIATVVEVTSKLVNVPFGTARQQLEPGSQTEQASPSAVLLLTADHMRGFRFLTISVAYQPAVSGRPAPVSSMAVGQFYNPEDGQRFYPISSILSSSFFQKDLLLAKGHPLAFNLSFALSLGLFPISLSIKTTGCGIAETKSDDINDEDSTRLCKFLCFPPLAFVWDSTSGLHIFPHLYSGSILVDSSPAMKSSLHVDEKTTILLLVDPHCSYNMSMSVNNSLAASRFLLLYGPKLLGISLAVTFYALMRQANAWEHGLSTPSLSAAILSNLKLFRPFFFFGMAPVGISLLASSSRTQPFPSFGVFPVICIACYLLANGVVLIAAIASQLVLLASANAHLLIKSRYQASKESFRFRFAPWIGNLVSCLSSLKIVRIIAAQSLIATCIAATVLGCLAHAAVGLWILLLHHIVSCHYSLCSYVREKKRLYCHGETALTAPAAITAGDGSPTPKSAKSFGEKQLEFFHHRHGLLLLHSFAALMFSPSLLAWLHVRHFMLSSLRISRKFSGGSFFVLQRFGKGYRLPRTVDSAVCVGAVLHGALNSRAESNTLLRIPWMSKEKRVRADFVFVIAAFYCYSCGLDFQPYKAMFAISGVGFLSLASWTSRLDGIDGGRRKHSHRH